MKLISVHFRAICFLPSFCEADTRKQRNKLYLQLYTYYRFRVSTQVSLAAMGGSRRVLDYYYNNSESKSRPLAKTITLSYCF